MRFLIYLTQGNVPYIRGGLRPGWRWLEHGLRQLGHEVRLDFQRCTPKNGEITIAMGVNLREEKYPERTVLFQTEQPNSRWLTMAWYKNLLRESPAVWDYSPVNLGYGVSLGWHGQWVPLAPVPSTEKGPPLEDREIDVLFYGAFNPRRRDITNAYLKRGLNVKTFHVKDQCFEDQLDAHLRNAKTVLNVHFYMPGTFEQFRVIPAIEAGCRIVSEVSPAREGHFYGVDELPYDQIRREAPLGEVGQPFDLSFFLERLALAVDALPPGWKT